MCKFDGIIVPKVLYGLMNGSQKKKGRREGMCWKINV